MTLLLALAAFTWRAASLLLTLLFLALYIEVAGLTTGRRPPVYLNRTLTLRFDGTGTMPLVRNEDGSEKKLPNLGEGIFVTIRNPLLAPTSVLLPDTDVEVDDQGRAVDRKAAMDAGNEVIARLVVDWCVPDPDDMAEEPESLPLPTSLSSTQERIAVLARVPGIIGNSIAELISEARNPR